MTVIYKVQMEYHYRDLKMKNSLVFQLKTKKQLKYSLIS